MNVRRVMLVIPPGAAGTTPNREGASGLGAVEPTPGAFRYPPHAVAMVTATLRQAGFEVQARDAIALDQDLDRCVRDVRQAEFDLVGVFVSWATREVDGLFLGQLRQALRVAVPVVAFGVSTSLMREHLADVDYTLEGEPELSFPALCAALHNGEPLSQVVHPNDLGIGGYDVMGLVQDLNALPFPDWNPLAVGAYTHLTVLSSRGCDATCAWCPYVVAQGHRYRACAPERTVDELREIVRRYGSQRVILRDPVFARDLDRAREICRLVIDDPILRPGRALRWECESRPEHFDPSLVRLLALAGCTAIKVGVESADVPLLCALGRTSGEEAATAYLAQIKALVRSCRQWGIACRLYALAGLPGETVDSARRTAEYMAALGPDTMTMKVFKAYPGLDLPGALPPSEDVPAQLRAFEAAQRLLDAEGSRGSSSLRRRLARATYRVSGLFRRES